VEVLRLPPVKERDFVVAMDIGGTKLLICLLDSGDRVVAETRISTEAHLGPQAVVERLVGAMRQVLRDGGVEESRVLGIGISSAGPSNPARGLIYNSPNLAGWRDIPLARWIEEKTGLRACLGNDANLAALAEHTYGAGQGVDNMVYVTVSTGIGGGIVANGKLYIGGVGTAGEIGHTIVRVDGPLCSCGRRGCLESFSAGWALAERARRSVALGEKTLVLDVAGGKPENITAQSVFEAAAGGDMLSRSILDDGARYLGVGLANLAVLLDPEMMVIGGGMSIRWDDYVGKAAEYVHATEYPLPLKDLRIVPARLVDKVSIYGALALARQTFG
jgi:glucokinase